MSESERRRKYRYDRVLIDTARVLSSTFDDAVVFLSGVQLEMLRNVTQYLRRLETYVSEYNPGYYLAPTAEDYDDILAIVSDLEETLMGNPNTIFGYKQILMSRNTHTKSGDGDHTAYIGSVPVGELWRISILRACNEDSVCSRIGFRESTGMGTMTVHRQDDVPADEIVAWDGMLTIEEGGSIHAKFFDCLDGDFLWWELQGYRMAVPDL